MQMCVVALSPFEFRCVGLLLECFTQHLTSITVVKDFAKIHACLGLLKNKNKIKINLKKRICLLNILDNLGGREAQSQPCLSFETL